MTRVAVDLLGGDDAPRAVVEGALLALAERPGLSVTLVGPPEVAEPLLGPAGPALRARVHLAPASQAVGMDENPARAVRAKRDATVRVAARLVRDGAADATVSTGSTGAAMAAALFTLGRLPGVTRPALALPVPAPAGPVVLLDVGANVECTPDLLAQFALAGAAYARVRLGLPAPRVGLLSVGTEPGRGDPLRRDAAALLAELPVAFVGNVEAYAVPLGGPADVVVTDGFTGNVLLKGLEGAVGAVVGTLAADLAGAADPAVATALARAAGAFAPDTHGGAVLLGVDGVAVVGHGSSSPRALASCVVAAASAHEQGLVPRLRAAMADLVARRRAKAGLPA